MYREGVVVLGKGEVHPRRMEATRGFVSFDLLFPRFEDSLRRGGDVGEG